MWCFGRKQEMNKQQKGMFEWMSGKDKKTQYVAAMLSGELEEMDKKDKYGKNRE